MKFNADEIASVIQQEIEQFESQLDVREVGTVLEVSDGIARVYGLSGIMAGEMVEFPGGIIGLAFNLEENSVGIIILGDYLKINEGDQLELDLAEGLVKNLTTGETMEAPPLPPAMRRIIADGGMVEHIKKHGELKIGE